MTGQSTAALGNLLRLHMAVTEIDLSDLVEIRCQLEQNTAASAAMHATEDEIAHLRELITSMRAGNVEEEQFNELDTEFQREHRPVVPERARGRPSCKRCGTRSHSR